MFDIEKTKKAVPTEHHFFFMLPIIKNATQTKITNTLLKHLLRYQISITPHVQINTHMKSR